MAEEVGCARPTGAQVGEQPPEGKAEQAADQKEKKIMTVKVGDKAPDFQAPAFFEGEFTQVQLADYLGKWLLLCFYPGDFTFV